MRWSNRLKRNKKFPLVVLSFGFAYTLGSCATTASYKTVKLPVYGAAFFSECAGKDGSISIETYERGKIQQSFDADWNSDPNGNYSLASYSPLGQTLFQLDYDSKLKTFKQTGKPLKVLEDVKVGKQNMLEVDGHKVGVRTDEVTCLLNQKLPQRWLKRIVAESTDAQGTRYIVEDSDRTIEIYLPKAGLKNEENWSAKINWSLYWGLKDLDLKIRLLKAEQALVLHTNQFDTVDLRIIPQEE